MVPVIDTITGPLLKYNVNTLAPVLTRIVNSSIETSLVPCVMKHAVVTPLLTKTGLDPENMMNYRPISNLSFVSKLLEKHVSTQVRQHLEVNTLFDVFQSAYSLSVYVRKLNVVIFFAIILQNTFKYPKYYCEHKTPCCHFFHLVPPGVFTKNMSAYTSLIDRWTKGDNRAKMRRCQGKYENISVSYVD